MTDFDDLNQRRARLTHAQRRLLARRLGGSATPPVRQAIQRRPAGERTPLSDAQKRLWFLWRLDPSDTAYHLSAALRLEGALDRAALQRAFDAVTARREALRTVVALDHNDEPFQQVEPAATVAVEIEDVSGAPDPAALAAEIAQRFSEKPFDLAAGPLMRALLLRLGDRDHVLVVAMHHIVSDAWSKAIIIREFAACYRAAVEGGADGLPTPAIQYADYARWRADWLGEDEGARQLAYWKGRLGTGFPTLDLGTDHPPAAAGTRHGAHITIELAKPTADALRRLASAHGASLFAVLLTGYLLTLYRRCGQSEIRIGIPVANRNHREVEDIVGLFVNTLVLPLRIDGGMTLQMLVERVRDAVFEAQSHQDLPFERLVEALNPPRSAGRNPLFQTMFNLLSEKHEALENLPSLRLAGYLPLRQAPQFDLALDVAETTDGRLNATFLYDSGVFERSTVQRLAGQYVRALESLIDQPGLAVCEVSLLGPADRALLQSWTGDERPCGDGTPIHRVIEGQAAVRPDAVAVTFGDETLTYRQLNARSNRLAHALIAAGVGPEQPVGVAAERSLVLPVILLAVLKAGAAYVPLDPEYPAERLGRMIADAGLRLILVQGDAAACLPIMTGVTVRHVDEPDFGGRPDSDPAVSLHGENLAYAIFTSGSTGGPKGAANRHRALANRLAWMQRTCPLTADDTVLQKTPFSFDVSVWEFFWPLASGARLAMAAPGDHRDPARLAAAIRRHGVTTLHFVPSMLRAFVDYCDENTAVDLSRVRQVFCSGEALPIDLARRAAALFSAAELHNLYGPTEAAIDVTAWAYRADADAVPIGRPIAGVLTRILDPDLHLAPPGAVGELYLGGVGLGRGYLNRPGLTADRFVADPYDAAGGRLYRTGDLARWCPDGAIDYLGRVDHQVKIRGLRIELGEIETRLLAHPSVRDAAVVTRTAPGGAPGGEVLAAYVVTTTRDGEATLRRWLAAALPDYMVPAVFVFLDALPLNANGKIDRKALPPPRAEGQGGFVPPEGPAEATVAAVWSQALGGVAVGRHDNFFALGGHSLLAATVARRIGEALGVDVALADLFRAQTPAELAVAIDAGRAVADDALRAIDAFMDALEIC